MKAGFLRRCSVAGTPDRRGFVPEIGRYAMALVLCRAPLGTQQGSDHFLKPLITVLLASG